MTELEAWLKGRLAGGCVRFGTLLDEANQAGFGKLTDWDVVEALTEIGIDWEGDDDTYVYSAHVAGCWECRQKCREASRV